MLNSKLPFVLALFLVSIGSFPLFAPRSYAKSTNETFIEARCSTPQIADGGYEVTIERSSKPGAHTLVLNEGTIAGPVPVAILRVERFETVTPPIRSYVGTDIRLDIDLGKPAFRCSSEGSYWSTHCVNSPFRAQVTGKLIRIPQWSNLFCTVEKKSSIAFPNPLPHRRGGKTCMAYWSGAYFNPKTASCEATGGSGCTSPLEFRSIAECEEAFATRPRP